MAHPPPRQLLRELTTLPSLLTLVRVPLGLLLWVAPANLAWVLGLMAAAAVSDLLDGWVARRQGLPPENLGAWLDPLCDKFFVASAILAVWFVHAPPWWMALVASARELLLLPLVTAKVLVPSLRNRHVPFRAKLLGKATTVAQFALFAAVLSGWREAWAPLAVTCGVLGAAASVQYTVRAVKALAARGDGPRG